MKYHQALPVRWVADRRAGKLRPYPVTIRRGSHKNIYRCRRIKAGKLVGPWFWVPEWELKETAREVLEWHRYELEEVFKVEWYAHPGQAYLSDVRARLRDGRYPKGPYGLEGERDGGIR